MWIITAGDDMQNHDAEVPGDNGVRGLVQRDDAVASPHCVPLLYPHGGPKVWINEVIRLDRCSHGMFTSTVTT